MILTEHESNLDLCAQFFPNLSWSIEADSVNGAVYKGNSHTLLTVYLEANLEGYRESLVWDDEYTLFESQHPFLTLLAALQNLREEWQKLAEVMS